MTKTYEATLVADTNCRLGESPYWDPDSEALTWIDIDASTMHRHVGDGERSAVPVPEETSFVARAQDGFIAVGPRGVYLFEPDGTESRIVPSWFDPTTSRTNDGAIDSKGRLWIGSTTRDRQPGTGAIGVVRDGTWDHQIGDLTLPNGIGWSPDDTVMYYVDTFGETLWRADFDPVAGAIDAPEPFHRMSREDGLMDGLAVDAEGRIWVAIWGGHAVLCLGTDGSVVDRVAVGAPKVTSCAFAGETLFITTANPDREDPPGAGGLFAVDVGIGGVPVAPMELPA